MSFFVVEVDNEGFKVYDSAGNLIDPAKDSSVQSLLTTLSAIKDTDGIKKIVDPLPAGTNNIGDVDVASSALPTGASTEAKQDDTITKLTEIDTAIDSIDGKVATESTLASIKDTDGIKKITDALPTGDNWIGKTKVGDGTNVTDVVDVGGVKRLRVEASQPAGELHNVVLYDSAGHPVGVVLDGSIYRLQADAKVAKGASDLVHLEALDTVSGMGRLKATIYTPDDDAVSFTAVPPNPASIRNDFVREPGDSEDLLVDGSGTPVVFTYDADTTYDISIQEVKFVLVSNSITFGSGYFGATAGPLANGLLVEIISDGNTGTLGNIQQNEDFVNFASPGGFDWVVSSKDMIYATYLIGGGLKLKAGTTDKVRVTVRDDIAAAGVYLQCFVKGNLLGV